MRIAADPPTDIPVEWYFAPTGAPFLRVPTAFVSSNWDPIRLSGPPDVGEDRLATRKYSKGRNVWGYTGGCRIGTDLQFLQGLSADDLAHPATAGVPACCRPPSGKVYYPNVNMVSRAPVPPAGKLGPWDQTFATPAALLDDQVSAVQGGVVINPSQPGLPAPGKNYGALQFVSNPLPQGTVSPRPWTFAAGMKKQDGVNLDVRLAFWVGLADGTTGLLKLEIVPLSLSPVLAAVPGESDAWSGAFPGGLVDAAAGDVLVYELGYNATQQPGIGHSWRGFIAAQGINPVPLGLSITAQPQGIVSNAGL
jgi:hypothetical protein